MKNMCNKYLEGCCRSSVCQFNLIDLLFKREKSDCHEGGTALMISINIWLPYGWQRLFCTVRRIE